MQHEAFLRTERLIGSVAVESLHQKKVTMVGLGAVGGYALEALARLGVGSFTLIDKDTVSVTNLNRQILATHDTLGRNKCDVAKERILSINPEITAESLCLFVDKDHLDPILDGTTDLVIDAIDSLGAKCDLLATCYEHHIPVVSSMGAALRRNPGMITTADLMETSGCPLARLVRQNLRHRGIGKGIKVVYSPEPVNFTYKNIEDDSEAEGGRRVLGSLPTITGIFGLNLAHLALQSLLGNESLLPQENENGTNA